MRGEPLGHATLEHILPRHHGGDDSLMNIAVACSKCNALKGSRIDGLPNQHPTYQRVIAQLRLERDKRHRAPLGKLALPPFDGPD